MKVLLFVVILVDIIGSIDSYGLSSTSNKRFSQSIMLSRSQPPSSLLFSTTTSRSSAISITKNSKNPINRIKTFLASVFSSVTNTIKYIITFLALLLPSINKRKPKVSDSNDDVESIDSVIAMAKLDTAVNAKVEAKQDELLTVTILTSDDIPEITTTTSSSIQSSSSSTSLSSTATEQNKKWVENKLKELKEQTADKVSTTSSLTSPIASSSSIQSNENESSLSTSSLAESPTASSSSSSSSSLSLGVEDESTVSLKDKIKAFGISGTISYILTEIAFWAVSIPIIIYSYHSESGQWLDFTVDVDRAKILGLSAAFLTAARLAVPLRLGVALSFTPFVEENITNIYFKNSDDSKDSKEKSSVL